MGTYSAAAAIHEKTLVANTVDTVTLTNSMQFVEVISDSAADLYVTFDGSTPSVAGDSTYRLPAASAPCVRVERITPVSGNAVVKLKSAGTPKYSVTEAG